ncbi:hypothetical protein [Flectobacillus roseus]|uniref:Outer membrane protein beta-barrel domain-containing protein n=1 Tax=Flectobacillus roseus TaxID=502259 RepID=A0ABT6Y689_9BACT|nr:hypothetical protein [Flectobacillus roseus]MDI9858613.1 hypothetical protein [Flectobacillus roseus]
MKKFYLLILSALLVGNAATAQSSKPTLGNSINIQFGSFGFGAGLARQLKPGKFNLRISAEFLDSKNFVKNPIKVNLGDGASDVLINPTVTSMLLGAKVDWHVFKKSSFKLVGGVSYGSGDFYVDVEPAQKTGRFKLAKDVELDAEEFGTARLIVSGNKVRPYLGLGFGRAIPKHKLGFSVDLGTYYTGSPKLAVPRTGMIESILTDQNISDIEKNIKNYSFVPNITFSITYKLNK